MRNPLDRADWVGLVANVLLILGLATGSALLGAFVLGWDFGGGDGATASAPPPARPAPAVEFAPPPGFISVVWAGLFTLMGVARWLVVRRGGAAARVHGWLVVGLALFCVAYPYYTLGLRSLSLGLAGNVATAALAAYVAYRVRRSSAGAAALVSLIVVWLAFASAIIVRQIQLHA